MTRLQSKAAVRYESRDASEDERLAYRRSVAESLAHSAPVPITEGLATPSLAARSTSSSSTRAGSAKQSTK
jgi:hypothetical protein